MKRYIPSENPYSSHCYGREKGWGIERPKGDDKTHQQEYLDYTKRTPPLWNKKTTTSYNLTPSSTLAKITGLC